MWLAQLLSKSGLMLKRKALQLAVSVGMAYVRRGLAANGSDMTNQIQVSSLVIGITGVMVGLPRW